MTAYRAAGARVYLDHAATTPPDPRVVEAMLPYLTEHWANPASIYVEAQQTRRAIDEARQTVAASVGANASEIVFTAGGSESDSLALRGVLAASERRGRHLITSAVEVLDENTPCPEIDGDPLEQAPEDYDLQIIVLASYDCYIGYQMDPAPSPADHAQCPLAFHVQDGG